MMWIILTGPHGEITAIYPLIESHMRLDQLEGSVEYGIIHF